MRINTGYPISYTGNKLKTVSYVSKSVANSDGAMEYLEGLSGMNRTLVNSVKPYDIPIKNITEFRRVFKRVSSARANNGDEMWISGRDKKYYQNADEIEKGLIPYCGIDDSSQIINRYLSNRLTPEYVEKYGKYMPKEESSYIDAIRVLDFSLNNLDKEFGKFSGCVFRQGVMKEDMGGAYISTSADPRKAARLHNSWVNFDPESEYSVIRTKNGHKLNEFQRKMGTIYANCEEEILLPRGSRYEQKFGYDMDYELIEAREMFAKQLFCGSNSVMSGDVSRYKGFTREKLLDFIKVYDEI